MKAETFIKEVLNITSDGTLKINKSTLADMLDRFGEIKWRQAQQSSMRENQRKALFDFNATGSISSSLSHGAPIGRFTPYNKD